MTHPQSNFHSEEWIMDKVKAHLEEAQDYFPEKNIVGIFVQGSQNYGLDYEGSDIDTKLIVCPSFEDLAFNKKPISTTHIRQNEEHIDFKDIRLYIDEFRKQNINFLEVLFTPYFWVNPLYKDLWELLRRNREDIAHYNPFRAIKSMKGMSLEKHHALEKDYPSKIAVLEKFGYDPKQFSHILRLNDFITRYIAGESFNSCLIPTDADLILRSKKGEFPLEEVRVCANNCVEDTTNKADMFCNENEPTSNDYVDNILNTVQREIMRRSLYEELNKDKILI